MKHYNLHLLNRWMRQGDARGTQGFKPFPGKYPTRLFIRVRQIDYLPSGEIKRTTRFLYNGVFKSSILKRYRRFYKNLDLLRNEILFVEYHQDGLVSYGSPIRMTVSPHHARVHYSTYYPNARQLHRGLGVGSWNLQPEVPVRLGPDFVCYVPEKAFEEAPDDQRVSLQRVRRTMVERRNV